MSANDVEIAVVRTNGLYLFADGSEKTVNSLPLFDKQSHAAEVTANGLEPYIVRVGSHSHVGFFTHLRTELATLYENWVIADVGGYIGAIGLPLAKWISLLAEGERATVTIFEPTSMAEMIARSITFNGLEGVAKVLNVAASDRAGTARFSSRPTQRVSGHIGTGKADDLTVTVETVLLDSVYGHLTDTLVIAKIDTEGHEPAVLNGFTRTIENNPCVLIVEFHQFCLGKRVAGTTYEDFLFDRFQVFNVGNIGYPKQILPVADTAALKGFANRDGNKLTDIICFSKKIPGERIAAIVAPYNR
ncbi:hypothetical protein BH10PSE7_BH10PSE7_35700 [soil metagenome]